MRRDGLAARLTLLAAFACALILPRDAMPCCQAGACCPPVTRNAAVHSCCGTAEESPALPASPAPQDSEHDQGPLGGLGCASPCCTKAPAPAREPLPLHLAESGSVVAVPSPQLPRPPDAGGVFHPPRV